MSRFTFTLVRTDDDQFVTVFAPGRDPLPASSSHPNFDAIVSSCVDSLLPGSQIDADEVADLFDVAGTVSRKFARLSERVTVDADGIKLDGDPVHGTLQEQILDFLDKGEDFDPLVAFYEKLTTNPLGDVREGLYDWIKGQTASGGKLSITQDGNVLGYKSVQTASPEWRTEHQTVYVPSRRGEGTVNGVDVGRHQYIEQVPGDVVEMARSKVLNEPSMACGDGLHIGTFEYAQSFSGDTVMLVEFSPRDIVSLPDSCSVWKLRVCRYKVVGPVTEPLEVPVYLTEKPECGDECENGCLGGCDQDDDGVCSRCVCEMDLTFEAGDRIRDEDGDEGVVLDGEPDTDGFIPVRFDDPELGYDAGWTVNPATTTNLSKHGRGGPTSDAAKGRGRNPYQDEKGRFVAGRPGSRRDNSTGRFA